MSKSKDPATLEVFVSEEIGMAEDHPGSEPGEPEATQKPTREEVLQQVLERKVALSKLFVENPDKPSRTVMQEDLERVIKDANTMMEICMVGRGDYTSGFGLAHTQIEGDDPLRFYVRYTVQNGEDGNPSPVAQIIVNPVIVSTGGNIETQLEGCLSYPGELMKNVTRFNSIKVRFQTVASSVKKETGEKVGGFFLSPSVTQTMKGLEARIAQHEISHLNGFCIYHEKHTALSCTQTPQETLDKLSKAV